jgi:hypothetical protein
MVAVTQRVLQLAEIKRPTVPVNRLGRTGKPAMAQAQQGATTSWLKLDLNE